MICMLTVIFIKIVLGILFNIQLFCYIRNFLTIYLPTTEQDQFSYLWVVIEKNKIRQLKLMI